MNFYSTRDMRTASKSIWESLANDGEVVITNNGKPSAIMINIEDGNFEEMLAAIKQAHAMMAVNKMRETAATNGFLSEDEIQAEIIAARKEK